jgi:hypothetical protein
MNARKIATSVRGDQYQALERERRRLKLKRSQAVQQALDLWLAARVLDDRVERYLRGYARQPDDPRHGLAYAEAFALGHEAEDWS